MAAKKKITTPKPKKKTPTISPKKKKKSGAQLESEPATETPKDVLNVEIEHDGDLDAAVAEAAPELSEPSIDAPADEEELPDDVAEAVHEAALKVADDLLAQNPELEKEPEPESDEAPAPIDASGYPKTLSQLDSMIAKIEGKKSQSSIGNVREIRKIISDLMLNPRVARLMRNDAVQRRAVSRKKALKDAQAEHEAKREKRKKAALKDA